MQTIHISGVGSGELQDNKGFTLFPNPSTGVFMIQAGGRQMEEVRAFDALGRPISFVAQGNAISLLTRLPGIYYLSVTVDDQPCIGRLVLEY